MDARRFFFALALLTAGLLLTPGGSRAQDDLGWSEQTPARVFFSLGVGAGSQGIGGQISVSVHRPGPVFLLRTAGDAEIDILGPSSSSSDIAFLMGRLFSSSRGWGRLALGPGWVERIEEGGCLESAWIFCARYEKTRERTVGLASQIDAVWTPLSFLGFGLGFFGNLNSARSFGGATLTLHLGRVK